MSDFEKLSCFHGIKSYLSEDDQKELAQKLNITDQDLQRLIGKDKEIEFYLILFFLDSCMHILAFDEGTSQLTDSKSPDALIKLKDGRNILIEIKSKVDQKYKITQKDFDKRKACANDIGFPLYFAINLDGVWGIFSSDYIQRNNYTIIDSNYVDSEFDKLLGNRNFVFPKGLNVELTYSKNPTFDLGLRDRRYGRLISYQLYFGDKYILHNDCDNKQGANGIIVLEALHEVMALQYSSKIFLSDDITVVYYALSGDAVVSQYRFMQHPISYFTNKLGFHNDANSFYKDIVENTGLKENYITKEVVTNIINILIERGVPIKECGLKDITYIRY